MRTYRPLTYQILEKLTGFKPEAESGQVPNSGRKLILSESDFPIYIEYEGKQYVIIKSRRGGLLMNAA